jgi:hypothetical protein
MSLRKPLVLSSGQITQLQSGDTLDAPQSGGDVVVLSNGEVSPVVIGAPVYINAADSFLKAKSDATATSKARGLVAVSPSITNGLTGSVMVAGVLTATTTQWDSVVESGSGGLTFGTDYFLSPTTAGKITATAPSTVGQSCTRIGTALSTTELMINIQSPILL